MTYPLEQPDNAVVPAGPQRCSASRAPRSFLGARLTNSVPIPRLADGHFDPATLERAVAQGFRIVRWQLDDGA
jgi:hypothetical protein